MEFTLRTSGHFYSEAEMAPLQTLGFIFEKTSYKNNPFLIKGEPKIIIDTLDELVKFIDTYGKIVVDKETIEIYNDYRE